MEELICKCGEEYLSHPGLYEYESPWIVKSLYEPRGKLFRCAYCRKCGAKLPVKYENGWYEAENIGGSLGLCAIKISDDHYHTFGPKCETITSNINQIPGNYRIIRKLEG